MKLFGTEAVDPAFRRVVVVIHSRVLVLPLAFFFAGCATTPRLSSPSRNAAPVTASTERSRNSAPKSGAFAASTVTVAADDPSEPIEIFSPAPRSEASPEDSERDPATAPDKIPDKTNETNSADESPQRKSSSDSLGRGDNWFLRDLPVMRFKFPDDDRAVEGVHYKKINLHRCSKIVELTAPETLADPGPASVASSTPAPASAQNKSEASEPMSTAYFPGRNLEAIEVQLHGQTLGCTTGAVEVQPDVALAQLLKSSPTALMYSSAPDHVTAFSRTAFNQTVESTFEVSADAGNGTGETDEIFVPTAIDPSDRVYVAAKGAGGSWRLILPVAGDVPLKTLSEKLALIPEQADTTVLDLLASNSAEETSELADLMAKTWSTYERTSDDLDLRDSFYSTYRIPLRIGDEHSLGELAKLTKKFTYRYASSDISTNESFHTVGERKEFVLSRSGPMWRAVASLIHQVAHAIQTPGNADSADLTFRNEMDAQVKQDVYLKRISARSEGLKLMIENYNWIAAVAARRVRWADAETPDSLASLCDKVIDSYGIDRKQIAASTLQEYRCLKPAN